MSKQVFKATEKSTGKTYTYAKAYTYGRPQYRLHSWMGWAPSLKAAKEAAISRGEFRYDGDAPIVRYVD
jgi:hypothetical protein